MDAYNRKLNVILSSVQAIESIAILDEEAMPHDVSKELTYTQARKMVSFWVDILNRVEPK